MNIGSANKHKSNIFLLVITCNLWQYCQFAVKSEYQNVYLQ